MYYHIRKFVPRLGVSSAILGVCLKKNGHVQEDINSSIYIINLNPLEYNNLFFPFKFILNDLEKKVIDRWGGRSFLPQLGISLAQLAYFWTF